MLIDKAKVFVKAGDGGNGCISFRREKYVPKGGPNGGNGGDGGDVVFVAQRGIYTLREFKFRPHLKAKRGSHGQGSNKAGKRGEDLVVMVPTGTIVRDAEKGFTMADLDEEGASYIACKGGRGGRGNAAFATPTRRAPRIAEKGGEGEAKVLLLELKLIADVGLVGLPNSGKSTLLSRITSAHPKIAPYPFTTKEPNLGVCLTEDEKRFIMADIPGLIEGAHEGAGLGHEFLRHIERTLMLAIIVDLSNPDPERDFSLLINELGLHDKTLLRKPMVLVGNKIDLPKAKKNLDKVQAFFSQKGLPFYPVSALKGIGTERLVEELAQKVSSLRQGKVTYDRAEY